MANSGGGGGTTQIVYADYIQKAHFDVMVDTGLLVAPAVAANPYPKYTVTDPTAAFLGLGFAITAYPSVFDMYGKFNAGLDLEALYDQIMSDELYGQPVNDAIAAESTRLDNELDTIAYPRLEASLTAMNAAMASGFMMAEAYLEDRKQEQLSAYAAKVRIGIMELAHQRWAKHLEWNISVIKLYMEIIKSFFDEQIQYLDSRAKLDEANILWPFKVFEHYGGFIGLLNGAAHGETHKASTFERVVSGAVGAASFLTSPTKGGKSSIGADILSGLTSLAALL